MTDPDAKPVPGWIKTTLEIGPVALFFLGYFWLKDETYVLNGAEYGGFIVVTALFVPLILITTGLLWWLTGTLSKMQVFTAVLVTVMGGLSVWLNDERFLKIKPTLLYLLFAGILFIGLMRGRSFLADVLSEALPLTPEGWMILTRRMAWFFVILAVANEVVWRFLSTEVWVTFKTFDMPIAMFVFLFSQAGLLKAHALEETTGEAED
ncbi:inner membrane-spanning protein YciB [Jannaschia donghaensis]|uniref:Inner membrane-spanning protein YciB n=1 Tax=Jannaschia donghaensis TaxID=420998 RepID=A0A0M6YG46_9RHOB|nr:inner membrane-spanning protein YciB [Jannaschia donghaensis]CTQ48463.1 Intracellular septation protein [Jannaschia donghaensis]